MTSARLFTEIQNKDFATLAIDMIMQGLQECVVQGAADLRCFDIEHT